METNEACAMVCVVVYADSIIHCVEYHTFDVKRIALQMSMLTASSFSLLLYPMYKKMTPHCDFPGQFKQILTWI